MCYDIYHDTWQKKIITDTFVTINSDAFLENLKEGDSVMADGGFGTNQIGSQLSE